GKDRVATCVRRSTRLPVRQNVDARLVKREVRRNREIQRLCHLLRGEAEEIRRREAARDAVDGGMVERQDIHGIAEATKHFVRKDCRSDYLLSVSPCGLR